MGAEAAGGKPVARGEPAELHRSYLLHDDGRYLKAAAVVCALALAAYVLLEPGRGHSGSTWLGYTLGVTSAGLAGWLAWLGVRKRQLRDGAGRVRAWVSAHVYFGLTLWWLATLHSAFQFGWNVHTLAYVLLSLTCVSGIYGVAAYAWYPERITANRQQARPAAMLEEIGKLDQSALTLAESMGEDVREVVARSVARVRIGGALWEQLSGRYRKAGDDEDLRETLQQRANRPSSSTTTTTSRARKGGDQGSQTIAFMADELFNTGKADDKRRQQAQQVGRVMETLAQRNHLVERLNRDITLRARQNVWLFLHVPLSVALLAALVAHLLAVFMYW